MERTNSRVFLKGLKPKQVVLLTLLLAATAAAHAVAIQFDQIPFLRAIALRLYYLPVLFAALMYGLVAGCATSLVAVALHLVIMSSAGVHDHAGHADVLYSEHLVELPFIVLVGTLTGLLQDFRAQAQKERREVEALFGSYVSPELVSEVLNEKITFKGEEKSATVMFTDLIGFTKLAERLAPAQLLELLNVYFAEKVEIVLMHRGYINKFIGDSIMAVFGAPLDQAEHPMQAVRTAIQMHLKLDKINAQPLFKDNQLGMGIGINTGLVIAGNVGSARRMEYTVLGDTVNLASRIEALTRKYGTGILIGESTHNQIREDDFFMMREIDSVRVKGRHRSVVLYEVYNHCTSDERQKKEATLEDFQSAIASYRDCDWDRSETVFQRVLERYPEDTVSKLYLARLDTLRITPPPEDWKGVFEFLDK